MINFWYVMKSNETSNEINGLISCQKERKDEEFILAF